MLKSIIIEGIDRLGKDTLIQGLKNQLGYFQVIHYQKPELLEFFLKQARQIFNLPDDFNGEQVISLAQKQYQINSFTNMMKFLSDDNSRFIMNRSHLGEAVYSKRYRNYSGDYIFDLEKNIDLSSYMSSFTDTTLLVLLHTSSFNFIKDDGQSFDFSKKDEEQMDFVRAFEKSDIKHKLMLDVHDGKGGFVPKEKLLSVVIQAYKELQAMPHQIMLTTWNRDEQGNVIRFNSLQPDPKKIISSIEDS